MKQFCDKESTDASDSLSLREHHLSFFLFPSFSFPHWLEATRRQSLMLSFNVFSLNSILSHFLFYCLWYLSLNNTCYLSMIVLSYLSWCDHLILFKILPKQVYHIKSLYMIFIICYCNNWFTTSLMTSLILKQNYLEFLLWDQMFIMKPLFDLHIYFF